MAFKRVHNDPKTPGGTPGETPNKHHPKIVALATTIGEWLSNGLEEIRLYHHRGRAGFQPTEHLYVVEDNDGVVDVEGVTVRGVNPLEFAISLFGDIRDHADVEGASNYRVVGFREDDNGDTEKCFSFAIPKRLLADIPDGEVDPAEESIGSLLAGWKRLAEGAVKFNGEMQNRYLALANALPDLTGANAEMLLANAKALGEQKPAMELELAKMQREREQETAEVQARLRHHRQQRNADLGRHAIDVLGPDVAAAFRMLVERYSEGLLGNTEVSDSRPSSSATSDASPSQPSSSSCPLAQRLNDAWAEMGDDAIAEARDIFGPEIWGLIETARAASTDDEFKATIREIDVRFGRLGANAATAKISMFLPLVGPEGVKVFVELLNDSRA